VSQRRQELAEAATDHVLEHGLLGLSLRPLAAALGTSDRMLLYHFRDKDDLVATVLRTSNDRSVCAIRAMPAAADVRTTVLDLWGVMNQRQLQRCQRLYVEASALGVLGTEPYASVMREANEEWMTALADPFRAVGLSPADARRAASLVDAAFMGLQLDEMLDAEETVTRAVKDLADAVAALWPAPAETD
jgi:AcrR family transcriptional regulator